VRRSAWAAAELATAARQQPHAIKRASVVKKNQSTNVFGETLGRLHLEKQVVEKMGGRKAKALRRAEQAARAEDREATEVELQREGQELDAEFQSTFGLDPSETVPGKESKSSAPSKKKRQ
jgi:ribosome production factor 2